MTGLLWENRVAAAFKAGRPTKGDIISRLIGHICKDYLQYPLATAAGSPKSIFQRFAMVVFALLSVPIAIGLAYIPHSIKGGILVKNKKYDNTDPRNVQPIDPDTDAFVKNLTNCHFNQLESLGPYASGIAAATAVGVAPGTLTAISATYVGSRAAFILAYLTNNKMKGYHRSLAWVGAMTSVFWLWIAAAIKKNEEDEEDD